MKRPYVESAIHILLRQLELIADSDRLVEPVRFPRWVRFINSLRFDGTSRGGITIRFSGIKKGSFFLPIAEDHLYVRGDITPKGRRTSTDAIENENATSYMKHAIALCKKAGFTLSKDTYDFLKTKHAMVHFALEEQLFDMWARTVDLSSFDVRQMNEAATAPEMRYITKCLGDLKGKRVVDLGCGLGEASVYFALLGANVTAVDLSLGMLDVVKRLAKKYHVSVAVKQAAVEYLKFPRSEKFDVFYAGNVFHHIDIEKSLSRITPYLSKQGKVVCWEPVAYNPVINIYRNLARKVRSYDEQPIRMSDIDIFRKHFRHVDVQWFWLTTLLIFIIMILVERRNPNKERLWKSVVRESDAWSWLYVPLSKLDTLLLTVFPFLRPLCWNVVIVASDPIRT